MAEKVQISDLIDKAIIKSFEKAECGILPRRAIIKLVIKRLGEKETSGEDLPSKIRTLEGEKVFNTSK
jgi:hypothetical protein